MDSDSDDDPLPRSRSEIGSNCKKLRAMSMVSRKFRRPSLDDDLVVPIQGADESTGSQSRGCRRSASLPGGRAATAPPDAGSGTMLSKLRRLLCELERRGIDASKTDFLHFHELPLFAHALAQDMGVGRFELFRSQLRTKLHQHFRQRWPTAAADWTDEEVARGRDRLVGNRAFGRHALDLRAIQVQYINAAVIPEFQASTVIRYVATQHPMANTVSDFWRMVLLVQPSAIIMLNGAEALYDDVAYPAYWTGWTSKGVQDTSDGHSDITPGPRVAESVRHRVASECMIRSLRCVLHGLEWQGPHVLVGWWKDQCAPPLDKFLALLRLVNGLVQARGSQPGPVLVHCAGGIGRTGVFIATDCGARAAAAPGADSTVCSPDRLVAHLRRSRMNMVQTAEQYECLHLALPPAIAQLKASSHPSEWLPTDWCSMRRTRSVP